MAKFMTIHNEDDDEYIINLDQVTAIDPEEKSIDFSDQESIYIGRQSEWEKIMSFVKSNEI